VEKRKAPASIHVASLALLLAASVQGGVAFLASATSTVGFGQWVFAAAVLGVLIWGIARGYRLAWLWGRYLALVLSVTLLGLAAAGAWMKQLPWGMAGVMIGGIALPLLAAWLALGRRSSIEWFDLRCPECGAASSRGKDFLFREARCPKCGKVW
jgi:hypothetical protein